MEKTVIHLIYPRRIHRPTIAIIAVVSAHGTTAKRLSKSLHKHIYRRVRKGGAVGERALPPPTWKKVPLRNVQKRRESSAQMCRQKRMCMFRAGTTKLKRKLWKRINKWSLLLYLFSSFIVLYLTFLNDYSGPVEPVQTFFKNHKGPCKRTQHCWPTTRNIIRPNMFHPFAWNHNNVGTCWYLLRIVWNRSNFWAQQTDATLLVKNPQLHATMLWLVASVCTGLKCIH